MVRLKPIDRRARRSEEIISEQRARFAREVPGVEIEFVQLLQDMLGDLEGNPEPVEVKVFGDDLPTLLRISQGLTDKLRKIDGLVDIVGPRLGNPELLVKIDTTRAAKAGFTPEQITQQLSAGMLGARGDRSAARRPPGRPSRSISRQVQVRSRVGPQLSADIARPERLCRCRRPPRRN